MTGRRMDGLRILVTTSLRGLSLYIRGYGRLMGGIMYVSLTTVLSTTY